MRHFLIGCGVIVAMTSATGAIAASADRSPAARSVKLPPLASAPVAARIGNARTPVRLAVTPVKLVQPIIDSAVVTPDGKTLTVTLRNAGATKSNGT